jgi:hypothetical protein
MRAIQAFLSTTLALIVPACCAAEAADACTVAALEGAEELVADEGVGLTV